MSKSHATIVTTTSLAMAVMGCGDYSHDRALADTEVGGARVGDASFTVSDGLGAFHVAEPGRARIWIGAPVVELTATVSQPREWLFELENAMPDGQLTVTRAEEPPTIEQQVHPVPTKKRFGVTLATGTTVLRFGPADDSLREPWRFALMSDIQTGVDRVEDMFAAINQEQEIRFLLGAGDLAQNATREELETIQQKLEGLGVPYYTTIGNHDAGPDSPWHAVYGRGNFRFRYRGVQFSMLDSASASIDPLAYDWLEGWLEDARADVHVVAMHIPPLDPVGVRGGAFGSRNEAAKLMTMLSEGQVDVTLYGHIHSYYQYDSFGIPAFISGGGGAHQERLDGIGRHFMVVEVGADAGVVGTRVVEVDR